VTQGERTTGKCHAYPGFPVEVSDAASFMRFSLQKTAHAGLSSAASRKSGYGARIILGLRFGDPVLRVCIHGEERRVGNCPVFL
jgi:hypothetical protein